MKNLILITVLAIILVSAVLVALPDDQAKTREIITIVKAPMPEHKYTSVHKANYELRQMYKKAAPNKLLEWKARKNLEDEQRDIEKKRKNWKRYINGKYVFGYDERYDPKVYIK